MEHRQLKIIRLDPVETEPMQTFKVVVRQESGEMVSLEEVEKHLDRIFERQVEAEVERRLEKIEERLEEQFEERVMAEVERRLEALAER